MLAHLILSQSEETMNFRISVAVIESSPLKVVAASDFGVSIEQVQLGQHIVTFPKRIHVTGCIATQNNSVGTITAIPGSNSALTPNQVRVLTFNLDNTPAGGVTYTLVAFYPVP
jgi:hypothetical protein